jgi:D-aminoacyl-tRNA deacylase
MGGGKPGRCPPPSPRIAPLFRRLAAAAARSPLAGDFDVTLEVSHHGPWVSTPSLFAEIGSTEGEWGRRDAAALWASVLAAELRLGDGVGGGGGGEWWDLLRHRAAATDTTLPPPVVAVGLGGGHYAPRHGDLVRRSSSSRGRHGVDGGVFLGHMAASYALDFRGGGWRDAVRECVDATRRAYPVPPPSPTHTFSGVYRLRENPIGHEVGA